MAISVRAVATTTNSATPLTVAKPTGVLEGDLLLFAIVNTDAVTPTPPAGFTLVPGAEITGTTGKRIYQKVAGASEPADYSMTYGAGTASGGILALTPAAGKTLEIDAVSVRSNASGDRVWDEVITTVADTLLACFAGMSINTVSAPHSGMDERWDIGGSLRHIYLMTAIVAGVGATGTRTAAGSTSISNCIAIALRESGAVPGGGGLGGGAVNSAIFGGGIIR